MNCDELFDLAKEKSNDELFDYAKEFIATNDYDSACKFFRMAYVKGDTKCAVILGKIHISLDQIEEALKWFYISAKINKDPEGMCYLADCNYFSVGVEYKGEGNLKDAFELYREASLFNHPDSLFKLSIFYKHDYSFVKKDYVRAFKLCKLAAEGGSERGQINTAVNYLIAKGTIKNIKLAIYWLKKAIAQNNKTAIIMMSVIAKKEKHKEAIEWVKLNTEKCEKANQVEPVAIDTYKFNDPRQIEMLKCVDWDKYAF